MPEEIIILIVAAGLVVAGIKLLKIQINDFLLKVLGKVVAFLLRIKSKHQLETLRKAIHDADADRGKTGRKNMVIFNTTTKKFEPIQKKKLKQVSQVQKKKGGKRTMSSQRIKQIEKKSLYVTR